MGWLERRTEGEFQRGKFPAACRTTDGSETRGPERWFQRVWPARDELIGQIHVQAPSRRHVVEVVPSCAVMLVRMVDMIRGRKGNIPGSVSDEEPSMPRFPSRRVRTASCRRQGSSHSLFFPIARAIDLCQREGKYTGQAASSDVVAGETQRAA